MAGSCTMTEVYGHYDDDHSRIDEVTWDWLSDGAGDMSGTGTSRTTAYFTGMIADVETVPDGGGTAPDPLYDIMILDDNGVDVMLGAGANRSQTVTENTAGLVAGFLPKTIYNTRLQLVVANSGAANGGIVRLRIVR